MCDFLSSDEHKDISKNNLSLWVRKMKEFSFWGGLSQNSHVLCLLQHSGDKMIYDSHRVIPPIWWSASFSCGLVSSEGHFTELEAVLNIFSQVFHICVFSKALYQIVLRKAPFGLANEVKATIWQLVSHPCITFSWMVEWKDPSRRLGIMSFTESVPPT